MYQPQHMGVVVSSMQDYHQTLLKMHMRSPLAMAVRDVSQRPETSANSAPLGLGVYARRLQPPHDPDGTPYL